MSIKVPHSFIDSMLLLLICSMFIFIRLRGVSLGNRQLDWRLMVQTTNFVKNADTYEEFHKLR